MLASGCPRCGGAVALHEGRPHVTATGGVELWHSECWQRRDEPRHDEPCHELTEDLGTRPVPARSRRHYGLVIGGGVLALATTALAMTWSDARPSAGAIASVELRPIEIVEPIAVGGAVSEHESVPPEPTLEELHAIPDLEGTPLDHVFTSLAGWTHPVVGSAELLPERHSRRFGSTRVGIERDECGDGHCGVDLDGPRGRPIVSVADGIVVRVERREHGADGRSGRYVRVQHDDGTLTAYMHLDDVAELGVGDQVRAGQYLGTLGASGILFSAPHLHFSLEVPLDPDQRGDVRATRYVDPAPFLVRAKVVEAADRRRATRPAL
jgi:murein DD-endopeptidase MepM/ murein hydrolase activator NlpD